MKLSTHLTVGLIVVIWLVSFVGSLGMSIWGQHPKSETGVPPLPTPVAVTDGGPAKDAKAKTEVPPLPTPVAVTNGDPAKDAKAKTEVPPLPTPVAVTNGGPAKDVKAKTGVPPLPTPVAVTDGGPAKDVKAKTGVPPHPTPVTITPADSSKAADAAEKARVAAEKTLAEEKARTAEDKKLLQKQPWDTFGPQLAIMLAFIFGTAAVSDQVAREQAHAELTPSMQNGFALLVSILYCCIFVALMANYAFGGWKPQETVEAYTTARPYCSALVTGMMILYFGKSA